MEKLVAYHGCMRCSVYSWTLHAPKESATIKVRVVEVSWSTGSDQFLRGRKLTELVLRPQSQWRRLCSAGLRRAAQPLPAVAAAEGGEAKDSLFHVLVSQVPRGPDGSSQARSSRFEKVLPRLIKGFISGSLNHLSTFTPAAIPGSRTTKKSATFKSDILSQPFQAVALTQLL